MTKKIFFFIFVIFINTPLLANSYKCNTTKVVLLENNKISPLNNFEFEFTKWENLIQFNSEFILVPNRKILLRFSKDENFSGSVENNEMWVYENGKFIYSTGVAKKFMYAAIGICTKLN